MTSKNKTEYRRVVYGVAFLMAQVCLGCEVRPVKKEQKVTEAEKAPTSERAFVPVVAREHPWAGLFDPLSSWQKELPQTSP